MKAGIKLLDIASTTSPTFQTKNNFPLYLLFHLPSFTHSQVLWKSDIRSPQISWMGEKDEVITYVFKGWNYEN